MTNKLKFTKMHGLGNDFVVFDGINQAIDLSSCDIRAIADRHRGVGADQLILIEASTDKDIDFNYRIFNPDGSEVGQCGNAARCLGRFLHDKKLSDKTRFTVKTTTTTLHIEWIDDLNVSVNMGVPEFNPSKIPFSAEKRQDRYPLELTQGEVTISALAIGNPHAVIVVDDLDQVDVPKLGAEIERHPRFSERVNVGFLQVLDKNHAKLRVFERGAGETQACGSGACAAMVAGQQMGLLSDRVKMQLVGGTVELEWSGEGNPVMMKGSASYVFEGTLNLEELR